MDVNDTGIDVAGNFDAPLLLGVVSVLGNL
jgi:hypothetical protein